MLQLKPYRKCELCGSREHELHVHHLNYDCLFTEGYNDLVVLCRICHKRVHDEGLKLKRKDNPTREHYFNRLFYYLKAGYEFQHSSKMAHDDVDSYGLCWGGIVTAKKVLEVMAEELETDCILIRS